MKNEPLRDAAQHELGAKITLIAAMAIWGLNVAVVKELTHSFDTYLLATLRMVVALTVLSGILLWRSRRPLGITWKQAPTLLVCGFLMVYLNQLLFAEGLQRSTATNGALIMALSPLVSAVLAALMFRESLSIQRIFGVALGFVGVAAVVISHPGSSLSRASTGDLMLVAGVVSFAVGGALVQRLARSLHTLTISWAVYMVGTLMLVAQAVIGSQSMTVDMLFPGFYPWTLILFSGVMATALSGLLWNRAIATIGVARTAVFLYLVPVFGVLSSALLIGERLTAWHVAGFVAVMSGTYLGTRNPSSVPPTS